MHPADRCRRPFTAIQPVPALPSGHFTEYLERFPDDQDVRWLLNVAHMTLGEYPEKVDSRYRVSIDPFLRSEFDIGKFRDIGHLAKVDRFNMAGGAVMEDFDNDGLLDLATTSFDATVPMASLPQRRATALSRKGPRRRDCSGSSEGRTWFRPISTTTDEWICSFRGGRGLIRRCARACCGTTVTALSAT